MSDPAALTIEEVARTISGHGFKEAYPYFADDVSWSIVGQERLDGRAAVVETCERTVAMLAEVVTEFERFRALVGEDWVVIDSFARYTDDQQQTTTVASCDIYDFAGGLLTAITSYNIEVAGT